MNRKQRRSIKARMRGRLDPTTMVRYSNIMRALRRQGSHEATDAIERCRAATARCPTHGELADPILVTMPAEQARGLADRGVARHDVGPDDGSNFVVFGCPDCSDGELRRRWEQEGNVS